MRPHYFELVLFSTYAELRAERSRSYLGLIWWILEPAMNMAVYYLVFVVILRSQQQDYLPFLLIGLTLWQWFKSCATHGAYSIWQQLPLIRQVKLPSQVFPSVQILADTVKFLFILGVLVAILWRSGYVPGMAYLGLIPVLLVELLFAAAAAYCLAAIVPFLPDLRFIIEQVLQVAMYLSGIVFALDMVPERLRFWFAWNPMAVLVDAARAIMMHGQWPDWSALGRVTLISLALYVFGVWLISRLHHRYVKLPT